MVSFTDHYNAIYIERLSSEIRKDSFLILLFYLQQRLFLVKTQKTNPLQQVTGGEKPNVVLKRMLELPPLKKY